MPSETNPAEELELESLVDQFLSSIRRGEHPSVDSYAQAHPDMAEEIRELFPIVAAMEGWKEEETAARGGNNSLGGVPLKQLGDFRILREIGRGGMGIVFEAIQESLDRPVAVKILPPNVGTSERAGRRFRREAMTAASLHHSNIVPVFGIGHDNGFSYIVMQRIDGCGLDQVLHRRRDRSPQASTDDQRLTLTRDEAAVDSLSNPLSNSHNPWVTPESGNGLEPRLVARLGLQAADALEYAHSAGTLHRDIKPANLLLDQAGHLWVADFGLARALEQETISHSGDIVGTLLYMAPERLRGQCDARSDIYSLGLTLVELLLGKPLFDTSDSGSLVERITRGVPARRGTLGIPLNADLETILLKSIAVDPKDRYQTAALFATDLRAFLDDRPISARQPTRVEVTRRWCRRNPLLASLTATVAALLLATIGLTSAGLIQQRRMRARTEATLDTTLAALDTIYNRFASPIGSPVESSVGTAALSDEAAAMLQQLLQVYDELASQGGDTTKLRREAVLAQLRVADIHLRLGAPNDAMQHYGRALDEIESLQFENEQQQRVWLAREAESHLGLASAAEWLNDFDTATSQKQTALNLLVEATAQYPGDDDLLLALARAHYLLGRSAPSMFTTPTSLDLEHAPRDQGHRDPLHRGPAGQGPGGRGGQGPGGQGRGGQGPDRPGGPFGPGPGRFNPPFGVADFDFPPPRHLDGPPRSPEPPRQPSAQDLERRQHLLAALELLSQRITQAAEPVWVGRANFLLALTHYELAQLPGETFEDSISATEQALSLLNELATGPLEGPRRKYETARVLMTQARLTHQFSAPELDSQQTAEANLNTAVSLLRELREDQPRMPEYSASLARACETLALSIKHQLELDGDGRPDPRGLTAESLISEAVQLQTNLVDRFPADLHQQLWLLRYQLSQLHIAIGRPGERNSDLSPDSLLQSLDILATSAADSPELAAIVSAMQQELRALQERMLHEGPPRGRPRGPR